MKTFHGYYILHPFQNVGRFGFSKFIVFTIHIDITYVKIHSKIYESKKVKTIYILERREYVRARKFYMC